MPFAGKSDIVFNKAPSTQPSIVVGSSTHDGVFLQDLYDAIREFEDDLVNLNVPAITVGSGKEGIGGGNRKPPTVVINSPWVVKASTRATTLNVFTFDGGTLLSDSEAANSTAPVPPMVGVTGVLTYDRAKGQEGLLLNVSDLLRLRQWMTNRQELSEASTDNFVLYEDDGVTVAELQTVLDKDGNPVVLPPGAPARRSNSVEQ